MCKCRRCRWKARIAQLTYKADLLKLFYEVHEKNGTFSAVCLHADKSWGDEELLSYHAALSKELRGDSSEIWWKSNCIDKLDAVDRVKKVRCSCRDCIVEMLEFAVEVKMTEQMYWFTKNELLPMKQAGKQISDRHVHNMVERGTRWRRMFDSLGC